MSAGGPVWQGEEQYKVCRAVRSASEMLLLLALFVSLSSAKVFERCELARELNKLGAKDISTWVCIAEKESGLNSTAVGNLNADGSGDHGLFQISDKYWCSPQGWACNIPCYLLEDDDITDDWKCVRKVFKQHQILSGNGFNAWAVYGSHCSGDTSQYVANCSENDLMKDAQTTTPKPQTSSSEPSVPTEEIKVVQSYSAREGNLEEKVQVLDLEMMEKAQKRGKSMDRLSSPSKRLWKPWTWELE